MGPALTSLKVLRMRATQPPRKWNCSETTVENWGSVVAISLHHLLAESRSKDTPPLPIIFEEAPRCARVVTWGLLCSLSLGRCWLNSSYRTQEPHDNDDGAGDRRPLNLAIEAGRTRSSDNRNECLK